MPKGSMKDRVDDSNGYGRTAGFIRKVMKILVIGNGRSADVF